MAKPFLHIRRLQKIGNFFVFIALTLFFANFLQAEKKREARTQDAIFESIQSSPWFDAKRKDYHRYKPEEIPLPKDRGELPALPSPRPPAPGGFFLGFLKILFFAILAVPVAALLYFLFRIAKEQVRNRTSKKKRGAKVLHDEIPEELSKDLPLQEAMGTKELRHAIAAALESDPRLAVIYMYLYTLLQLQEAGIWKLHKNYTGRDYLRQLQKYVSKNPARLPAALLEDFESLVRYFEFAMYKESLNLPQDSMSPILDLWQRLQRTFEDLLSPKAI